MKIKLRSSDPLAARCDLLVVPVADPAAPLELADILALMV